jgi:hypothetical protein
VQVFTREGIVRQSVQPDVVELKRYRLDLN